MRQRKGRDDNDIVNLSHSVFSLKKWRHKIKFGMPLMVRLSQNWTSSLSASLDENRHTRLLCTVLLPSAQKIAALSPLWWQNTLGNTWLRNSSFNTQSDISIYFSPIHSKIPKGEALFNGWKYFEYYPPCPPKKKKKKKRNGKEKDQPPFWKQQSSPQVLQTLYLFDFCEAMSVYIRWGSWL